MEASLEKQSRLRWQWNRENITALTLDLPPGCETCISCYETDLIHCRRRRHKSVDTSVAPSDVFVLDELWPLLVRRLWKQLLCPWHSRSPYLVGQSVSIGDKQLEEEGFLAVILAILWLAHMLSSRSPPASINPHLNQRFCPDLVVHLQAAHFGQAAPQTSVLAWKHSFVVKTLTRALPAFCNPNTYYLHLSFVVTCLKKCSEII